MDWLTALFAELIAAVRSSGAPEFCPGGWAWATSVVGVGVGLLPAAGAVAVALVRRRIGSRYGFPEAVLLASIGLISAGLLPLIAFNATGRVFVTAAAGNDVPGLGSGELADLGSSPCISGGQVTYLGEGSVAEAFSSGDPLRFGLALVLLAGFPLVTSMFVAAQARLALRRGPGWPAKFFWLPLLGLPLLTAESPAGSSGHLWIGVAAGSFLGILVVLVAGSPSQEAVRRSLEPRPESRPEPRPESRPARQATPPRPPPAGSRTRDRERERTDQPAPAGEKAPTMSDRLAERFAARRPEPPVLAPVQPSGSPPLDRGPQAPVGARTRPRGTPPPTLVAAAPPFPATGGSVAAPRFRMVRRLGSGGFGRVWLAHDARLGHLVALKAAHAPDAETEQRIQREAKALAAVRHPHCVRIHDMLPATSDPGLSELEGMVIVMQYVEGASLGELVRSRGLLDDVAAARVWASVAGALDAAHGRGVMHRDVKPGNVVVDPAGLAHLIDFGIARSTGDATMTMAGFVLGTPDYLAPEVACGERATPASDSWQLAATVSYALTGHPPRGAHVDAVSGLRAAASGARLSHLPTRSAHLALLRAAMDNDPGRRPPLYTVHRALEEWLHRAGARPDGPVTVGTRSR